MRSPYIPNPLNPDGHFSLRGPVVADPIFTPLFTSFFAAFNLSAGAVGIATSISTAIAITAITRGVQTA